MRNNDLNELTVPITPYTAGGSILNASSYTPPRSGFYNITLAPSSATSVYARLRDSRNNAVVISFIASAGVDQSFLVYLQGGIAYTVEKSASGINALNIRQ